MTVYDCLLHNWNALLYGTLNKWTRCHLFTEEIVSYYYSGSQCVGYLTDNSHGIPEVLVSDVVLEVKRDLPVR